MDELGSLVSGLFRRLSISWVHEMVLKCYAEVFVIKQDPSWPSAGWDASRCSWPRPVPTVALPAHAPYRCRRESHLRVGTRTSCRRDDNDDDDDYLDPCQVGDDDDQDHSHSHSSAGNPSWQPLLGWSCQSNADKHVCGPLYFRISHTPFFRQYVTCMFQLHPFPKYFHLPWYFIWLDSKTLYSTDLQIL